MATSDTEMRSALLFGFRVDENKYTVFQVAGWKVRLASQVEYSGSGHATCNCPMFRFESKCIHQQMIQLDVAQYAHSKSRFVDSESVIPWRDASPKCQMIVHDQGSNRTGVVAPEVGNLSLHNLTWLFAKDESTESIDAAIGTSLNPLRIFTECQTSLKDRKDVRDTAVSDAGKEVPFPSEAPVSSDSEEFMPPEGSDDSDESDEHTADVTERVKAAMAAKSGPTPEWKLVKRPHPSDFYVSKDDWLQICYSLWHMENLLLVGPSGSGKSQVIYRAAKAMGRHLEAFNMGAMSEPRTSLIGNVNLNEAGTYVSDARFVQTYRGDKGQAIILLDELTRAVPGAFNILLPALDDQRYLALDEHEDASIVHQSMAEGKEVAICATANVGMEYTGTEALDKALKDRFGTIIEMFFPPVDNEISVLLGRCPGLKRSDATRLVKIATKQRDMTRADEEFPEFISTRMLIAAGTKIGKGMSFELACRGSILNHFSGEGGDESDRTKVLQIIQKDAA